MMQKNCLNISISILHHAPILSKIENSMKREIIENRRWQEEIQNK